MSSLKNYPRPGLKPSRLQLGGSALKRAAALLLLALLLSSCAGGPKTNFSASDAELCLDLKILPQNLSVYAGIDGYPLPPDGVRPDTPILTDEQIAAATDRARQRFYAPWQMNKSSFKTRDALWAIYALRPERGFIENLRPYPPERWEELVKNSLADNFPNSAIKAITLRRADLRLMPTHSPYFFNPARAGQGYPFDYFQNSSLPPGAPVFISQLSGDGLWGFVETASASGWVDLACLAQVDETFIADWMSRPLAAVTAEDTLLAPRAPEVRAERPALLPQMEKAGIGTLLPYAAGVDGKITLFYPLNGNGGLARIGSAELDAQHAAPWPLRLDRRTLAGLGNQMIGKPYGWGGYGGNRDCSALMRDLFLPVGLWLPRNSASQAKIGTYIELDGLTAEQKEQTIRRLGKPFFSLVSMPGHIALYLGQYQGRAVIFHNIWGLRILGADSLFEPAEDGRAVLGKAVVTTLSPGRERGDIATPHSLLDRITGINLLVQ